MNDSNTSNTRSTTNTTTPAPSEKLSTWLVRISTVPENGDPGYDDFENFIELLVESRIITEAGS